jgi:hypothetical protein
MAKIVARAKAEVNAYAELRLGDYGVKCLMDEKSMELPPINVEDKNV